MALFKPKKKKLIVPKHASNSNNGAVCVDQLKTLLDDIKTHGTADRPDTIAVRKSNGTLEVTDPIEPQDAVSYHHMHDFGEEHWGCIGKTVWENANVTSDSAGFFPAQGIRCTDTKGWWYSFLIIEFATSPLVSYPGEGYILHSCMLPAFDRTPITEHEPNPNLYTVSLSLPTNWYDSHGDIPFSLFIRHFSIKAFSGGDINIYFENAMRQDWNDTEHNLMTGWNYGCVPVRIVAVKGIDWPEKYNSSEE